MRIRNQISHTLLLLWAASSAIAASSWTFDDATVSVLSKKAGGGGTLKEKSVPPPPSQGQPPYIFGGVVADSQLYRFAPKKSLSKPIILGSSDTLKVLITTKEDRKPKQPHQAFLNVKDPASNLETSFAIAIKDNGKGKVELVSFPPPTPPRGCKNHPTRILGPLLTKSNVSDAKGHPQPIVVHFGTAFYIFYNRVFRLFQALSQPCI